MRPLLTVGVVVLTALIALGIASAPAPLPKPESAVVDVAVPHRHLTLPSAERPAQAQPRATTAPTPPLPNPLPYWGLVALLMRDGISLANARVGAAIAGAESGYDPNATNVNADGSVDRGLFQINSYWHGEVSPACAYDPYCATQQAVRISGGGWNWTPWSSYVSGAYWRYLR